MKPVKVEFCETNLLNGSAPVYERLKQQFPEVKARVYGCLGNCDDCATGPYCLVNGEYVSGRDAEELWQNLLAAIRRCLARV